MPRTKIFTLTRPFHSFQGGNGCIPDGIKRCFGCQRKRNDEEEFMLPQLNNDAELQIADPDLDFFQNPFDMLQCFRKFCTTRNFYGSIAFVLAITFLMVGSGTYVGKVIRNPKAAINDGSVENVTINGVPLEHETTTPDDTFTKSNGDMNETEYLEQMKNNYPEENMEVAHDKMKAKVLENTMFQDFQVTKHEIPAGTPDEMFYNLLKTEEQQSQSNDIPKFVNYGTAKRTLHKNKHAHGPARKINGKSGLVAASNESHKNRNSEGLKAVESPNDIYHVTGDDRQFENEINWNPSSERQLKKATGKSKPHPFNLKAY